MCEKRDEWTEKPLAVDTRQRRKGKDGLMVGISFKLCESLLFHTEHMHTIRYSYGTVCVVRYCGCTATATVTVTKYG